MKLSILPNILIGLGLGGITILLHLSLGETKGLELTSILMVLIGSVYYGFALSSQHTSAKIIEIVVATLFVLMGLFGLWVSPWILITGLLLHGFWDIAHHYQKLKLVAVPAWYIPLCATYDWVIALYLSLIYV